MNIHCSDYQGHQVVTEGFYSEKTVLRYMCTCFVSMLVILSKSGDANLQNKKKKKKQVLYMTLAELLYRINETTFNIVI